jgi:hypothetical protein
LGTAEFGGTDNDVAPMRPDDPSRQREADSKTTPACARFGIAEVGIEHPLPVLGAHSSAAVIDGGESRSIAGP